MYIHVFTGVDIKSAEQAYLPGARGALRASVARHGVGTLRRSLVRICRWVPVPVHEQTHTFQTELARLATVLSMHDTLIPRIKGIQGGHEAHVIGSACQKFC